ncbi:preprotein translocase subunit YajC [Microbacterium gorillae]|uniref:preprotein translocase subunit YajC n=1 Tax=Microbacterium gorillae TaxID=1231063 RepID=UPI000590CA10|nr:preprotein translocase subunit YajC [Microbacterium gorillae]
MDYLLIVVLLALVAFMFWNSRKRMKKMKEEQEAKARQTVPGVEVMLNGGIFGTIVSYDPDDLDEPAQIEIAPGVVIRVHSQAIARIITPSEVDETPLDDAEVEPVDTRDTAADDQTFTEIVAEDKKYGANTPPVSETVEETRRRLEGDDKQA